MESYEKQEGLSLEDYLNSKPTDGFGTVEESLNCLFAETGQDREMDFNLEIEIINKYQEYLDCKEG